MEWINKENVIISILSIIITGIIVNISLIFEKIGNLFLSLIDIITNIKSNECFNIIGFILLIIIIFIFLKIIYKENRKINAFSYIEKEKIEKLKGDNKKDFYYQKIDFYFKIYSMLSISFAIMGYFYNLYKNDKIINDIGFIIMLLVLIFIFFSLLTYIYKSNRIIQNTILGIKNK